MPICLGCTLSRSSRVVCPLAFSKCKQVFPVKSTFRRTVASAEAVASRSQERASKHPRALTLLHQVSSLLPLTLPSTGHATNSLEVWNELLDEAYNALSERACYVKTRIVVSGVDECSGAHDLITALLDDTLSYDVLHSELLRDRPEDSLLVIENDHIAKLDNSHLAISSQWLQQFSVPVQVVEVPSTDAKRFKMLLAADFPIIVVNPVTVSLSSLLHSHQRVLEHPNAILAVTGVRTPQVDSFVQSLLASWSEPSNKTPTVLYIDPTCALSSLQTFKANSTSLNSIDTYQYGSLMSGIGNLSKVIRERLSEIQKISGSGSTFAVRSYTASSLLQRSLYVSRATLSDAKRETDQLRQSISELTFKIEELRIKSQGEILGLFDETSLVGENSKDEVSTALDKAKKDLKVVLDGLKWWKLLWRVDEISEIISTAVDKAWCKELERQLILHTGRLTALQQEFSSLTTALLSTLPPSSCFSSPLLVNTISQLQASPAYPLTHTSLTTPLHERKYQFAAYPTTRLHIKAQQVVLGISSSVLGGFGISWVGWLGVSESLVGLGAETMVGTGMLSAVFGLRWAVGAWEKAKKRWWQDCDRVGQGLSRDLKANLDRKIMENVVIVPGTACERLEALTAKRKEQIAELEEQVDDLEQQSRQLYKP